jgi:uncharacterized Zn-finger protein
LRQASRAGAKNRETYLPTVSDGPLWFAAECHYPLSEKIYMFRRLCLATETLMAGHSIPHFQNDGGYATIEIGVKEFMCTGASSPFDHPHIYIDLGDEAEKVCSYCSTLYRYNASLNASQTIPAGCIYAEKAA